MRSTKKRKSFSDTWRLACYDLINTVYSNCFSTIHVKSFKAVTNLFKKVLKNTSDRLTFLLDPAEDFGWCKKEQDKTFRSHIHFCFEQLVQRHYREIEADHTKTRPWVVWTSSEQRIVGAFFFCFRIDEKLHIIGGETSHERSVYQATSKRQLFTQPNLGLQKNTKEVCKHMQVVETRDFHIYDAWRQLCLLVAQANHERGKCLYLCWKLVLAFLMKHDGATSLLKFSPSWNWDKDMKWNRRIGFYCPRISTDWRYLSFGGTCKTRFTSEGYLTVQLKRPGYYQIPAWDCKHWIHG